MTVQARRPVLRWISCLVAVAILAAFVGRVGAMIRADFTPKDITTQSDVILLLEFKDVPKDGKATAIVKKVLKGKEDAKEIIIDLMAGAIKAQGQAVIDIINGGTKDAILFVGQYKEEGSGGKDEVRGMLHLDGQSLQWVLLSSGDKGGWDMDKPDTTLLGTWAGSTDMLQRAVEYALSDADAVFPVKTDEVWAKAEPFGKVAGKVSAAVPVDLGGDGKLALFVASDAGDKLFQLKDGKFTDVTAARKLASKSLASVWADFNMDGKLDLLSFDGKALVLCLQQADGTFASSPLDVGDALKAGCVGLAVGPNTKDGRQVIVSTPASPVSLVISKDSKAVVKPLVDGEFPGKDLGTAGKCLVADLDGDGFVDVLQMFAEGSLMYKGQADGQFAAPVKTPVALGKGRSAACLGDYDADGLLDIFTTAEDHCRIWQNLGSGKFIEQVNLSGETDHSLPPGGVDVATCDVNNDGRQDFMIAYGAGSPMIFFNRGFRSFGHSHSLDLDESQILPDALAGQQAACMAAFNGDGVQNMALVLKDGRLFYLTREAGALGVTVELSADTPNEPVIVTAKTATRSLGAWSVTAGGPPAVIGVIDAGPVTITWTMPGEKPQSKEVLVVDKPVRFVIGAKK